MYLGVPWSKSFDTMNYSELESQILSLQSGIVQRAREVNSFSFIVLLNAKSVKKYFRGLQLVADGGSGSKAVRCYTL